MATENNKNSDQNSKTEIPASVSKSPLDIAKVQQVTERKARGPYNTKAKQELKKEGWSVIPKAKTEVTEDDIEKAKLACYSDGIQKSIQVLYKKGLMAVILVDFKFSKIDMKFLPENPVTDIDAIAWAKALTDYMIENMGPVETIKYLRPIVLFGQPIVLVGQAHVLGKAEQAESEIDKTIKDRENKKP